MVEDQISNDQKLCGNRALRNMVLYEKDKLSYVEIAYLQETANVSKYAKRQERHFPAYRSLFSTIFHVTKDETDMPGASLLPDTSHEE